jgi:hypothetical protein
MSVCVPRKHTKNRNILWREYRFSEVKSEGKIKPQIEIIGRRGRRRRKLLDDLKERRGGRSRSHYVESSLWKRLWTCRKTDK